MLEISKKHMFKAINSDRHKLINYTRGGNWNKLYRGSLLHAHGGTVMAQLNDVLRVSWQRLSTAALAAVVLRTLAQELAHNSRQVVVLDEICREKQCKQHFCRRSLPQVPNRTIYFTVNGHVPIARNYAVHAVHVARKEDGSANTKAKNK